jgi:TusA-related sulfurtransferase
MEIYRHTDIERKIKLEGVKKMLKNLKTNSDLEIRTTAEGAIEMLNQVIREYN